MIIESFFPSQKHGIEKSVNTIHLKVKDNCPTPSCQAKLTILDKWRVKKGKKDKKNPRFRYGHMMEIELPEGGKSWSVAIRLPRKQERGAFQVFNAHFFHVYQTNDEGWFHKIID